MRDENGDTPLILASSKPYGGLIQLLLAREANPNATNKLGQSALTYAFLSKNYNHMPLLVRHGAELNLADTNGNTLLHLAASMENRNASPSERVAVFEQLLRDGALPAGMTFSTWLRGTNPLLVLERVLAKLQLYDQDNRPVDNFVDEPWKLMVALGADVKAVNRTGQTPLHLLVNWNSSAGLFPFHPTRVEVAVAELIRRGANPNARDAAGRTPLHDAARSGCWQLVQALLRHGADASLLDHQGFAPMHVVLSAPWPPESALKCVEAMVQHGVDINIRDKHGQTIVHHMTHTGWTWANHFLTAGAPAFFQLKPNLNAQDENGDTPLHLAARRQVGGVAVVLNRYGANPLLKNKAGESPWWMFAPIPESHGKPMLYVPGAKASPHEAAVAGDVASLQAWYDAFPSIILDANSVFKTPMDLAALYRQTNAVDFILSHGGKPDAFVALRLGRYQLLNTLLQEDASILKAYRFDAPLIYYAVSAGDAEAVRMLLNHKADVNHLDGMGFTPLYHALTNGASDLAAQLRAAGASESSFDLIALRKSVELKALVSTNPVVATNHAGYRLDHTPIMLAMQLTNEAAVGILLDAGVDPKVRWSDGYMGGAYAGSKLGPQLLHAAVVLEQPGITRLLLKHGAEINRMDGSGFTPLHLAAWTGQATHIKLLLENGADPNARLELPAGAARPGLPLLTMVGDPPLHVAAAAGQTNAVVLLVRAGADLQGTNLHGLTARGVLEAGGGLGGKLIPGFLPSGRVPGGRQTILPPKPADRSEVLNLLRRLESESKSSPEPVTSSKNH